MLSYASDSNIIIKLYVLKSGDQIELSIQKNYLWCNTLSALHFYAYKLQKKHNC